MNTLHGAYLPASLMGKCLRVAFAASLGTHRFSKHSFLRIVPNSPPASTHGGLVTRGSRDHESEVGGALLDTMSGEDWLACPPCILGDQGSHCLEWLPGGARTTHQPLMATGTQGTEVSQSQPVVAAPPTFLGYISNKRAGQLVLQRGMEGPWAQRA